MDDQEVMSVIHHAGARDVDDAISGFEDPFLSAPLRNIFKKKLWIVDGLYPVRHDSPKKTHPSKGRHRVAHAERRDEIALFRFTHAVPPVWVATTTNLASMLSAIFAAL